MCLHLEGIHIQSDLVNESTPGTPTQSPLNKKNPYNCPILYGTVY